MPSFSCLFPSFSFWAINVNLSDTADIVIDSLYYLPLFFLLLVCMMMNMRCMFVVALLFLCIGCFETQYETERVKRETRIPEGDLFDSIQSIKHESRELV